MIEVALMIEGQNGLNWPRWQRIAQATEDLGFAGLYRSDHFTNSTPPDKDSLELWTSLTWLASHTRRIEFGPLVSPISFRHPAFTARMAAAVDDLSGGRLHLGLGAGWQEREHNNFGFNLLELPARFARFEEGLQVITRLLHSLEPVTFTGDYFQLNDAVLLPSPERPGGPPIIIGGNGKSRTLPLVAKYADEWNAVYISAAEFALLNAHLNELLQENVRSTDSVRRSIMTGCVLGNSRSDVSRKVEQRTQGKRTADQLRQRGVIVGTPEEFKAQITQLADVGVGRVMLQWLDLDDLIGLKELAKFIL